MAQDQRGEFLLRIEDIDQTRSKPQWEDQIFDDLSWLGLNWPKPVLRQSDRLADYALALDQLWERGLLYPCTCNRRDILAASAAPQEGLPAVGPDGIVYPGTCRQRTDRNGPRPTDQALRLDVNAALPLVPDELSFEETGHGVPDPRVQSQHMLNLTGDVVLARRDMGTSYHLSVVLDDAHQQISHIVRGRDLFEATFIHVFLQHLLGLPVPHYHHHRLIRDDNGTRLAKRDDARAISKYRADGLSVSDVRQLVGLSP